MFGLEDQRKKKDSAEFQFDLEKDLKDSKKKKLIRDRIDKRVLELKELLRVGENKEDFDKYGVLLHGYTSAAKVASRFK